MSSAQELHSISELTAGEMERSQFVDNILASARSKRSKRSRPPFSVLTASGEVQGFCSSLSEISLQEEDDEEEEEEEKQHLAAYSLMMLARAHGITSHSHTSQPSSGTLKLLLPLAKKPKEFNDSPYMFQFDVGKGEGEGEKRYRCKTCSKKFFSFQALGGHRASCHKYKSLRNGGLDRETTDDDSVGTFLHTYTSSKQCEKVKVHECPICYRVFTSGQALGGHKRSHYTPLCNTTSISTTDHSPSPQRHAEAEYELDLNMPPPDVDCIEREESVTVWPHYAKANYNSSPYWRTDSSGKKAPSVYNGVVVG